MTVTFVPLLRAQARPHDRIRATAEAVTVPAPGASELERQNKAAMAARDRLFGRAGARPGANMPRTGKTVFRGVERPAVDIRWAVEAVCQDQQVSPQQIMNGTYCAAVAARHMLWTVLFDGRHSVAYIASMFGVDHSTVRLGIRSFREFQRDSLIQNG